MEEQSPLVSVVMPVYNSGLFLSEVIESVLDQTYGCWELIVVDERSTDDSVEIAQQYAARFPRKIRYVTHERRTNRGVSASRNLGTRLSRGSYVACLDSDDMWLPDKLEAQLSILHDLARDVRSGPRRTPRMRLRQIRRTFPYPAVGSVAYRKGWPGPVASSVRVTHSCSCRCRRLRVPIDLRTFYGHFVLSSTYNRCPTPYFHHRLLGASIPSRSVVRLANSRTACSTR
jgi:glycosyltransferase involved in cell wall biosynthesis